MQKMLSLVCEGRTPDCRSGEPIAHLKIGKVGYGYGLGIIQMSSGSSALGPVWWHNGTTAGYRAIVMWFPKSDIYVSLTINRGAGYLLKPTIPIVRSVMGVLLADANLSMAQTVKQRVKTKVTTLKKKVRHITRRRRKAHAAQNLAT